VKTITTVETLSDGRTRTSVEQVPITKGVKSNVTPQQRRVVTPTPLNHCHDKTTTKITSSSTNPKKSSTVKKVKTPTSGCRNDRDEYLKMTKKTMNNIFDDNMDDGYIQDCCVNSSISQPVGRSMKTKTIQHDDGRIETITEITETMSDGTTRTSSSSKFSKSIPTTSRKISTTYY
jgi:hypothetical protein